MRALRSSTLAAVIALASCQSSGLAGGRALTTGHDPGASIGTASIHIHGRLHDFVLVDPLGRRDSEADSIDVAGIPGCSRWPGGPEFELDDPDSSYRDRMLFRLEPCLPGRYELLAMAEDSADVELFVDFVSAGQVGPECPVIDRVERVPPGLLSWTLMATSIPSRGKCHVTILPPVLIRRSGPR